MLAQNFRTPTDLEITDAEFEALVKVLGMMERGEIADNEFGMWHFECGTARCIGGWARAVGKGDVFPARVHWDGEIGKLFMPECVRVDGQLKIGYGATLSQAACAVRNYLTTGKPHWEVALAD